MTPTTNAIATVASNDTDVNEVPVLDEYGRDASERTVELSPRDAEAIDHETTSGKHATYDDALAYVIARGLAEIKRVREAARLSAEKTMLRAKQQNWKRMLESNPALIASPELVATMLADLGVTAKAK
jgi:hypothetical protein